MGKYKVLTCWGCCIIVLGGNKYFTQSLIGEKEMTDEKYAYHLLHEEAHGRSLIHRQDDKNVFVDIPGATVSLPIDVRDQRTLVIFDGVLLHSGLPRNHRIVEDLLLPNLSAEFDQNKDLTCYMEMRCMSAVSGNLSGRVRVCIRHRRYFLLLPSCRAVVFRYRPKSLSPQGVVIEVKGGRAEFKTTSY